MVQEAVIKTFPKNNKWKKAKWLPEEALHIAEKRKDTKGKGEKERYNHLNAEFQRIARRDDKAFLSDQCKEREENNRMGKTRDLLQKIRNTKGNFHVKMDTIKDRSGMNLAEAKDIKQRCQEYTEELYKKGLDDLVTMMMWSITQNQTSWSMKSSEPLGNITTTKLVEVMEFQLISNPKR